MGLFQHGHMALLQTNAVLPSCTLVPYIAHRIKMTLKLKVLYNDRLISHSVRAQHAPRGGLVIDGRL